MLLLGAASHQTKAFLHASTLFGRHSLQMCKFASKGRVSRGSYSFPHKNREFFTDDYYQADEYSSGGPNPYGKQRYENDYEDYDQPTHRSTKTGVLSSYKKQLNLTANDVIMKDFYQNMKNLKHEVAMQFEKADRMNFTKTMVDKLRLGKCVSGPVEGAGDEYGNYSKFEEDRNTVKKVNDKGVGDLGYPVHEQNIKSLF